MEKTNVPKPGLKKFSQGSWPMMLALLGLVLVLFLLKFLLRLL